MRQKVASICAILIMAMAVPAVAQAHGKGSVAQERLIASCIHQSARGKPWLEKTLWGLRDQEGGRIGVEVRNHDGSHDLGPMQINSGWVPPIARLLGRPSAEIRRWLRENPCFNVEAARWLLLTELSRSNDFWTAIGRYHSPRLRRQRRYAAAIACRIADRKRVAIPSFP